jgi:hypothetical protein
MRELRKHAKALVVRRLRSLVGRRRMHGRARVRAQPPPARPRAGPVVQALACGYKGVEARLRGLRGVRRVGNGLRIDLVPSRALY